MATCGINRRAVLAATTGSMAALGSAAFAGTARAAARSAAAPPNGTVRVF